MIWNEINCDKDRNRAPNIFYFLRVGELWNNPTVGTIKEKGGAQYLHPHDPLTNLEIALSLLNILSANLLSNQRCNCRLHTKNKPWEHDNGVHQNCLGGKFGYSEFATHKNKALLCSPVQTQHDDQWDTLLKVFFEILNGLNSWFPDNIFRLFYVQGINILPNENEEMCQGEWKTSTFEAHI